MRIGNLGITTALVLVLLNSASLAQPINPPPVSNSASSQSDDALIDQSEFDAAVPALDPELNKPLQSLDEFSRQLQPDQTSPAAVTTTPQDAELAKPLVPLAGFDPSPVDVPSDDASKNADIRYTYRFEGLDGIDLADRLKSLSDLHEGDGKAANATVVAARATEDAALAVRLLKSEGYQDATATTSIEAASGADQAIKVAVIASPGPRYNFGSIVITGPDTVPPGLPLTALNLKTGDPIVAARVIVAEGNVSVRLKEQGYPFADVGARDILLDPPTRTGDYTLPVEPGPRSSFGGFALAGDPVFDPEHIAILARFKNGQLYDSRKVDDLREALVASNLFREVSVQPEKTGKGCPDGTEQVKLLVTQTKGPARTLAATGGYSTGEGIKLQASWTNRNLFPPEGALTVTGVAGTQEQSAGVAFRRSNAGRRDRTVSLEASASRTRYAAYKALTTTLAGRISYDSTPIWQKRFTYGFGFELIGTNERAFSLQAGQQQRKTYGIIALPGQLGFDTSDSLLDPSKGFRALIRISPEASYQNKASPYVRTMFEVSGYYPVTDSIVLAGRARVGVIAGVSSATLAPSRRYYSGGGGSVRGFGYQELGPKDADNNPIGGRSINEFAIEARYRFKDYGIVPFIDAGQVYDSVRPKFSSLRYGAGIGARYYTNFGPLRIDVATPLKRRAGESKVAVYLSIGQAF